MTTPPSKPPSPPHPKLEIPQDLEPVYSNMVRITHSPSEIIYDFALLLPANPPASVQARILMSPLSAKLFHRALGENLSKYESNYGEINIPGGISLADNLFRPTPPKNK